jgi:hypothetical protein
MDSNLILETTEFYEHTLSLALLMPPMAAWLQTMLNNRYKISILPFMHTLGYRHCVYVDVENKFDLGANTLISLGGADKKRCLILHRSILGFLEQWVERIQSNYYFSERGRIEGFPTDPT